MNPWLQQLGRVFLTETPPYSPRTLIVHGRSTKDGGKKPVGQRVKGHAKDSTDARVAELRKRYKKVQRDDESEEDVYRPKGSTEKHWF